MDDPLRPARQEIMAEKGKVDEAAVDLRSENEVVAAIFMLTRKQLITVRETQVVSISIPAIKAAMDVYGVVDQKTCLDRVLKLWKDVDREKWNSTEDNPACA